MAILNIRNLPDDIHARLRVRAAKAGRSMEAEARAILTEAIMADEKTMPVAALQQWVEQLYGDNKPTNVVNTLLQERREEAARE